MQIFILSFNAQEINVLCDQLTVKFMQLKWFILTWQEIFLVSELHQHSNVQSSKQETRNI